MENCKILWRNTEEYNFRRENGLTQYFFSNVKINNAKEIKSITCLSVNSKFHNLMLEEDTIFSCEKRFMNKYFISSVKNTRLKKQFELSFFEKIKNHSERPIIAMTWMIPLAVIIASQNLSGNQISTWWFFLVLGINIILAIIYTLNKSIKRKIN